MKLRDIGLTAAIFALGLPGCATTPKKGSNEAGQQLLKDDQAAIDKADIHYRDVILQRGESSHEAVVAKTELDNKKNKLSADQTHVQQLQAVNGAEGSTAPPNTGSTTSKETTTTTTITTTPQH